MVPIPDTLERGKFISRAGIRFCFRDKKKGNALQKKEIPKMKIYLELFLMMITGLLVSCTGEGYYGPQGRGGWNHMMGYGGYGGIFMWIILIVIAVVIIYFVINRSKTTGNSKNSTGESPTEILKKRYAKGEITKEEFDRLKREIVS